MEERGQNTRDDVPGPSSTAECPEVTTIPYGDDAFVYGNVCGEGPGGRVISPISGDEYGWAAREVKELRSQFRSRAVITNWIENSCVLRTLGYQTCIKLIACRDDERKDVYEDQLKPLDEIPEDVVLEGEEEEEVVANTEQDGVVKVSEPAADTVEEVIGDTPNIVID
ncbi:hypothetical protein LR48_Vigan01g092000 [Vigna angularis]|uniref:Uncharacterized protein n=1 Tax=Phaseolus angularis TaxID=3914 RepID=A0A0L9TLD6_PHAAN|nr:hypothetical protein LR48_Vigan01g092000 [Vigna angularis]